MIHFLKAGRDSHESESIGREFESEIVCGKKENLYDDVSRCVPLFQRYLC